jgi:hypothetical protein
MSKKEIPARAQATAQLPSKEASTRPYLPKRQRRSIKLDRVQAADLAQYDVRFFCDNCSHYSRSENRCSMGYVPQHTKSAQMTLFNLTGHMAFCRFLEID